MRSKLESPLVVLLGFAIFFFFQSQAPFISEPDGYYHAKFAYLLRSLGFIKDFSWTTLSFWTEDFSDKELLYHYLLVPFTYLNLQEGIKLATVCFATFSFWSFYKLLRLNKVALTLPWLLAFFSCGALFLIRMNAPRPHVLAVGLCLWSIHFILNKQHRAAGMLSFFYTLSYTGFILPMIFSFLAGCYDFSQTRKASGFQCFFWVCSGVLLATVANPYFPRNVEMFYLQNIFTLWMATMSDFRPNVGGEFYPLNTRQIMTEMPLLFILSLTVVLNLLNQKMKASEKTQKMFLFVFTLTLMSMLSKRFVEYAVPAFLVFCALSLTPMLQGLTSKLRSSGSKSVFYSVILLGFIAPFTFHSTANLGKYFHFRSSRFKLPSLELRAYAKDNDVIFSCDWDDTPELWYYNSQFRYLVFLDPNFMYYRFPEKYKLWRQLTGGQFNARRSSQILQQTFESKIGVCGSEYKAFRQRLDPEYFEILYEDPKSFVFRVQQPAQ
ncbi:hypothetical protein GW915_10755 [bacterium]|nr:hypothetical protein [bacterium]